MYYHAQGTQMWDGWYLNDNGTIHMYHMQVPPAEGSPLEPQECESVGHAVSEDLVHWQECPRLLPPLYDASPDDFHQKFTGCAVKKDGVTYVYYTMRDKERGSQRIGVALSDDMIHFNLYEGNPVIEPHGNGLIGYHNLNEYDWTMVDCRDLILVKDPQREHYYGYFATAADLGRSCPVGVVAMVETDDLLHFTDPTIVFTLPQNGMMEVPDAFYLEGRWYLTILTGANYAGRSVVEEDFITNCTLVASADRPNGPFVLSGPPLLAGPDNSGFTCRSVEKDGKRYLLYIDRDFTGNTCNTLALPKELRPDGQGGLRACYTPLTQSARDQELPLAEPHLIPNSFAWRTFGGSCVSNGAEHTLTTTPYDYQIAAWDLPAPAFEWSLSLSIDAVAGGIYLGGENAFVLCLEPEKSRMVLYTLYDFAFVCQRKFDFERGRRYGLRIFYRHGVLEVFVDDVLILQCGLDWKGPKALGILCDRGTVNAQHGALWSLE